MSYVNRVVARDPSENVVYIAHISLWSLLPNFMIGVICLLASIFSLMTLESYGMGHLTIPAVAGFALVGFAVLGHAIALFYSTEIAISNKQIITKPGIIARNGTTLLLTKCESCNLKQSVIGRVLNYGSIEVSGAGDTNAVIPGISEPMEFEDAYAEYRRLAVEPLQELTTA